MAREQGARESMRDAARRRAQETSHSGGGFAIKLPDGVDFAKVDGKTVEWDFIPYVITSPLNVDVRAGRRHVGDLVDACAYKVHRDIGVNKDKYVCPTTIGKPCPICDSRNEAKKKGSMSKEDLKALMPKDRMLYNVIDIFDKAGKMQVWDISFHMFTKQLEHDQQDHEEYYGYAEPDGGFTLRIRFEKKSIDRGEPFYETDRIDYTPRNPLSDADLKAAVDLDACLQILAYDKLEAIFLGTDNEPDTDQGETAGRPAAAERGAARGEERSAAPERSRGEAAVERPAAPARGRGEAAQAAEPARGGRGTGPAPAPAREARGRADTIHEKSPDIPGEQERATKEQAGRHGVDPDQDCPGGGVFGRDESKLDHCRNCDDAKWQSCRDEADRLAKAAKVEPAKEPAKAAGRGAGRSAR
jgi:hypothetical protein